MNRKLLYICGMGHCGSTIIDLALSVSPGVISVAQLNELYTRYDPDEPAPEARTERDQFWSDVVHSLTSDERDRLKRMHESVTQEKSLLPMLWSTRRRREFAQISERLLGEILDRTGGRVLVDSSKNISRCLALTECESLDVYVLHLIRDVRGLVNSANKRLRETSRTPRYLAPTLHWAFKNASSSLLVPLRARRLIQLRYEDFVARPAETIARLEDFLGEDLTESRRAIEGQIDIDPGLSLGFGGNRVLHNRKKLRFRTGQFDHGGAFDSKLYWYAFGWISRFWGYVRVPRYSKALPHPS